MNTDLPPLHIETAAGSATCTCPTEPCGAVDSRRALTSCPEHGAGTDHHARIWHRASSPACWRRIPSTLPTRIPVDPEERELANKTEVAEQRAAADLLAEAAEIRTEWTWRHNQYVSTANATTGRAEAERAVARLRAANPGDPVTLMHRTVSPWTPAEVTQ